ncbi:DctP family TRAP transporter solute-binding subunit [Bacillus sp. Xin]|uniref:DctP family TRAP transporter solute-binding subunit n=1 Tax=unclassified Bacillus (in: firmicutes) TaxID=185979 RepID=UPI0015727D7D|nr:MULTISPECIES: DctP family TRAP transporter solute-binding subunit [unclassified Bacillus (in: firmicutes)]MBC6971740.1 DctP family TRAP transporter solute-binding subunit [Bacillus sp. Xin]NSW36645.1 DctP family TRAP transporter solute-binding subunit [Bacillus sp. Xin1]
MKKIATFILLFIFLITSALFVGFHSLFSKDKLAYDDDQEGLNKQIVFKFSHVVAENTPKGLAVSKFAELVNEKSNGNIKIEIFPNGSLYSDIEEIHALKAGQVHFIAPSTSKLGILSHEWGVLDLPFAFPSYEAIQEGLNGKIGDQLLHSLQKDKIKGLAHWSNGFKQITSNKGPIHTPKDIQGQSFRIMQSDVIQSQFDLLNVDAHQDSFNSTYKLIETGKVDGEENTISNIYSKKFYNVQNYLTISNHGYLGYVVMMDQKTWNQQTEKTKQILLEAMKETTEWNNHQSIQMNEKQLELIKQNSSIQIHRLTDLERKEWEKTLSPIYEDLAPIIGDQLVNDLKELKKKYQSLEDNK